MTIAAPTADTAPTDTASDPISAIEAEGWVQTVEAVEAHYSSLSLHRKCAQAWHYRYDLGLGRPRQESAPERDFGSWWGLLRAADSLERGRRLDSLQGTPKSIRGFDGVRWDQRAMTVERVLEVAEDWWEKQAFETREDWENRLGPAGLLPDRLAKHYDRWRDTFGEETRHERPLGVEVFWKRSLPRPKGDADWDALAATRALPEMRLLGYIDELYEDTQRGMIVARDDKTSKGLPTASVADDMLDSQLQLYAWGVTPMLREWGLPAVRATAYDRMNSILPKPPHLTLSGSLATVKGEPSISGTDLETYRAWAAGPDGEGVPWGEDGAYFVSGAKKGQPKFGRYTADPKVLERLAAPQERARWFQRTLVPLSTNIVRAHLRAAVDSATDIWRTQQRTERTHEAARSMTRANCQWCDFASLCRAQLIGGPDGSYELAEHNLVGRDGQRVLGD